MTEKEDQEILKRHAEIDKEYGDKTVYDLKTHKRVYIRKDLLEQMETDKAKGNE